MKKVCVLAFILCLLCTAALATELPPRQEYVFGDYTYTLLEDGTAEITGYTGTEPEVVIPAEMDGHPVAAIGAKAFYGLGGLTRVTVPEGVTGIGSEAFRGCSGLEALLLPSTLTEIGDYAFYNCPRLAEFTLPEGLISIDDRAFDCCYDLQTLRLPSTVVSIGRQAFSRCILLRSIALPQSLAVIGENAFQDCSPELTVTAAPGSYAESWAAENGIPCGEPEEK